MIFNSRSPRDMVLTLCILLTMAPLFFSSAEAGAGADSIGTMKSIVGSIWYRERMMLPPDAEIFVFLEDSARMDAPAEVAAETSFTPRGGPPWDFTLEYDPAGLHEKGRYGLRVRIEANGRLLFINTSHVPAFASDPTLPLEIMVSRVSGQGKNRVVREAGPDASLTDIYWKLIELEGRTATLGAGGKEVHMVLTAERKVRGFSGCNSFSGSYELNGKELQFGPLLGTMMACMDSMEQEQRFLQAMGSVHHFSISGEELTFFNADGLPLLRFESVYLH